jgi:hypothetical protein
MQKNYIVGGRLTGITESVSITGSDSANNWMSVADGAKSYTLIRPINSAGGVGLTMPNSNITAGGGGGASGDYLKRININVNSATNSAVYLRDGTVSSAPDSLVGTGTAATPVLAAAATPALTGASTSIVANFYVNRVMYMTYTPTAPHIGEITIKRKIVSHPAYVAATSFVFTTTHAWPAGGVPSFWGIEHASSKEIVPFNHSVGIDNLDYGVTSINGPWQISVDAGVEVEVHGKFTA